MVFDDLYDTAINWLVAKYFLLKVIGINPFHSGSLLAVSHVVAVVKLLVQEFIDEAGELFWRVLKLKNKSFKLFIIEVIIFNRQWQLFTIFGLHTFDSFWIYYVQVGYLFWHFARFEKQSSFFLFFEVENIEHFIIVSQDRLEVRDHVAHEVFWPNYDKHGLFSVDSVFELLSEFFDACIENEFDVVRTFEAVIEHLAW